VIQQWAKLKYGVRVPIIVIPHSFGARLNFNSHLHILVSAGGLQESEGRWVNSLVFDEGKDKGKLMRMWRFAVITCLRAALEAKVLTSDLSPRKLRTRLKMQYERWWNIDIDQFASKEHFSRYAGRYVRRPPIAQYRFTKITDREVRFWAKDKIRKRRVNISCTPEEFVAAWRNTFPTVTDMGFATSGCCHRVQKPGPRPLYLRCWDNRNDFVRNETELGIFTAKGFWSRSPH